MNTLKQFTEEEIQKAREVSIHGLLGIRNKRASVKCPFHNDSSPSLLIDENNGFYCFGCEKKGSNAVDFVMAMGCSFSEAVEELLNN